jgi:hypothetical protein
LPRKDADNITTRGIEGSAHGFQGFGIVDILNVVEWGHFVLPLCVHASEVGSTTSGGGRKSAAPFPYIHQKFGPWRKTNLGTEFPKWNLENQFALGSQVAVTQCRVCASPLHCPIRDELEPESRVKRLTGKNTATGGSMPRPMMFFVPAILVIPVVAVLVMGQTSVAEPAVDECKTEPGSSAPAGSH